MYKVWFLAVYFSFKDPDDLQTLMTKVFKEGLEGLVLKDINVSLSIYKT